MPCAEKSESRILGDVNVLEGLLLSMLMSLHVDVAAADELWLLRAAVNFCCHAEECGLLLLPLQCQNSISW